MKSFVFTPTAVIAAVVFLGTSGCGAETSSASAPPTATSRPASDAVQSPVSELEPLAATQPLTTVQPIEETPGDVDAPMASAMVGKSPELEEIPELAMDSPPETGELEGRAVPAVPTIGAIDDQGNLAQPELGDLLIDFTLPRAGGGEVTLSEIGGDQNTVLVFYRAFW